MTHRFLQWLLLSSASLLLRVRLFDQAQALYIHALNRQPDGTALCRVYVGLAHTEFHRAHFLNARHYAKLCLEQLAAGAVPEGDARAEQLVDRAIWYYENSAIEAQNLRGRSPPP